MLRKILEIFRAAIVFSVLAIISSTAVDCLNICQPEALPRRPYCQYGTLPGRWWRVDVGEAWNVFSPECQLQNLLGAAGPPEAEPVGLGEEVTVLLFGDSVDRFIVRDVCASQEIGDHQWDMGVESFSICRKKHLTVARQAFIGVHPTGPWFLHEEGTPAQRLLHGLIRFQEFVGKLPDVVALSSVFWEIARWTQHIPDLAAAPDIPSAVLDEYGKHLSDVMTQLEGQAPEALWIFRTTSPPEVANPIDGTGTHANRLLGRHSHVVDLNAVGRDVARRHGWEIIDMESLSAKFHHHTFYLRDHHHPDIKMLWTALNMMLNLYGNTCSAKGTNLASG